MFEVLAQHAHHRPNHIALQGIRKDSKTTYNYSEYAVAVLNTSQVLQKVGLKYNDRLLVLSGNRPEWVIIDLAAQLIGVITCAVPPFASDTLLHDFVRIVQPSAAIVETRELFDRVYSTGIHKIYQIGFDCFSDCFLPTQLGLTEAVEHLYQAGRAMKDDRIAYLTPSSGTTGGVKACCISFGNARLYGPVVGQLMGLDSQDVAFSFLPLSQTRMQDHFLPLSCGAKVLFTSLDEDIYTQIQQYQPTLIASPPFLFEEVQNRFMQAKKSGDNSTLKDLLGGAKHLYTGTTPVDPSLLAFYRDNQCSLLEVYGMTEGSSMATMNYPACNCLGTQGVVVPNVQVSIAEDGEILISGSNVCAGYWNDPEKSQATIRDGWLHTGDIGVFDENAFLHLLGRKKELIFLSSGKKVFPKPIEDAFRRHPAVEYAVLVGNGQKQPGILISLHKDVKQDAQLISEINILIRQVNSSLEEDEKIINWLFVDQSFSIETGEITTSFKPRRHIIEQKHSQRIEKLFEIVKICLET